MTNTKKDPTGQRRRVQFDFTPESFEELQGLRERYGASSNAELVRDALRVLKWLIEQRESGQKLQVVSKDGKTERVELLF